MIGVLIQFKVEKARLFIRMDMGTESGVSGPGDIWDDSQEVRIDASRLLMKERDGTVRVFFKKD